MLRRIGLVDATIGTFGRHPDDKVGLGKRIGIDYTTWPELIIPYPLSALSASAVACGAQKGPQHVCRWADGLMTDENTYQP